MTIAETLRCFGYKGAAAHVKKEDFFFFVFGEKLNRLEDRVV